MSSLKKQAVQMIDDIPEDKMVYLIEIIKNLKGFYSSEKNISSEKELAFEEFKKFRGCVPSNINEKEELLKARDEKYANFD